MPPPKDNYTQQLSRFHVDVFVVTGAYLQLSLCACQLSGWPQLGCSGGSRTRNRVGNPTITWCLPQRKEHCLWPPCAAWHDCGFPTWQPCR